MSIGTTTHKDGILTGEDPGEVEKKTEAQKIDEYRPASMSASNSMFAAAEDDETPAIDQKVEHQGIITETRNSKPDFEIDEKFEDEIKRREAKEKAERDKRQKAADRKAKAEEAKRQAKIERQLKKSQSLDPDEIEEQAKEEHRKENLTKLYPDARPYASDVEEAIWQKRKENGAQMAGRAKIVDYVDEKLAGSIKMSLACQTIGIILFVLPSIISFTGLLEPFKIFLQFFSVILIITGAVILYSGANNTRHKIVPSDQKNSFFAASIIPGLCVRALIITVLTIPLSIIPSAGPILATVAGVAIGASIHYSFLNHYDIYVSTVTTLINTLVYAVYSFVPAIITQTQSFNNSPSSSIGGIYSIGISALVFFLADRMAMQLAAKSSK